MKFRDILLEYQRLMEVSGRDLAEMLGVSPSSLSNWLNGYTEPSPQRQAEICQILGVEDTDCPTEVLNIKPHPFERWGLAETARFMGVGTETMALGLQQGVFPWGYAVKLSNNRYNYIINKRKLFDIEHIDTGGGKE